MPANLNALIRYRTIDKCLSNPYREWTIGDLMEACSSALKENRGIYTGVSERTIREDIRVMRSDILGFNAPISQKNGNYYYEDRAYSIFNVTIRDSELLSRVLKFMLELKSETNHPGMDEIINTIGAALYRHSESSDFASELPSPGKVESSVQEPDYLRLRIEIPDDCLKLSWFLDLIRNFR